METPHGTHVTSRSPLLKPRMSGRVHADASISVATADPVIKSQDCAGSSTPFTITKALLSAAGRPTALDSTTTPKALLDIEGSPLIAHTIGQLHAGGIQEVVLVVANHGSKIIEDTRRICAALMPELTLHFVDLGQSYVGHHAHSLLSARDHFAQDGFRFFDPRENIDIVPALCPEPDPDLKQHCNPSPTLTPT